MLLPLKDRSIAYDLVGPENGPVVCMTHSLASDGGMWAEQVPPLLAAGFRVLRIDMRGHGGSDPVAGDYTMSDLAADVATRAGCARHRARALHRPVDRRHARPGVRARTRQQACLRDVVRHAAIHPRRCAGSLAAARRYGARARTRWHRWRIRRSNAGSPRRSRRATRGATSRSATPSSAPRPPAISAASRRSAISISLHACRR